MPMVAATVAPTVLVKEPPANWRHTRSTWSACRLAPGADKRCAAAGLTSTKMGVAGVAGVAGAAGAAGAAAACYGMAGATTDKRGIGLKLAWPSAEWGSLPLEGGVAAAFRREIAQAPDPALREREIEAELRALSSPYRTAEAFGVEEIIDPRDTRAMLCRFIDAAQVRLGTTLGPKPRYGVRP
jgi:hypothetical protein